MGAVGGGDIACKSGCRSGPIHVAVREGEKRVNGGGERGAGTAANNVDVQSGDEMSTEWEDIETVLIRAEHK